MTELNPPFALENRADHTAAGDRLLVSSLVGRPGIIGPGHLAVSQEATPDMGVDVAAGEAFIAASSPGVGTYHVSNDASKNLAIGAADPTNARNDLVVAEVRNSFYSGANDDWQLRVVQGTPSSSPSDPTVPDNAIVLARVVVSAGATQITDSDIEDQRYRASGLAGVTPTTSTTRPSSPSTDDLIVEDGVVYAWDGSAWDVVRPPKVACRVDVDTASTGTIASGWDTIHWNTIRDDYNLHDGAVRFTADRVGWWTLEAAVAPDNAAGDGRRILGYSVNGGSELGVDSDDMTSNGNPYLHFSITEYLQDGDYLRVHWFHEAGTSLGVSANGRAGASFKFEGS